MGLCEMNDLQDKTSCETEKEPPDHDEADDATGALLEAADWHLALMKYVQKKRRNGRPGEGRWAEGKK